MDRRAIFFLLSAVLCAVLIPITPKELRNVPLWTIAILVVLALLSMLDAYSRNHSGPKRS